MIRDLGHWFARKYVVGNYGNVVGGHKQRLQQRNSDGETTAALPCVFFRGSKSDRAVESGRDFVTSFNATLSSQVCCFIVSIPLVG
jgi:hypothetical protein